MKPALLLALMISYALPAASQPANQRAKAEAARFLIPCNQVAAKDRGNCSANHEDFLDGYIRAKSGNTTYMNEIADFFGTLPRPGGAIRYAGIRQDRRQGCAWSLTEVQSTADPDRRHILTGIFRAECLDVSPNDLLAIQERADTLLAELRDDPATEPPPLVDKDAIPDRCLDSTVTPLSEDPSTAPPFVPPQGCPRF